MEALVLALLVTSIVIAAPIWCVAYEMKRIREENE